VGIAGEPRSRVARRRGVGRPRRRPTTAHHAVVARADVHSPNLFELVRPDLADVRLVHRRIMSPDSPRHPDFTQELPRKLLPTRAKEAQRR
jgi:hypothetical protein